MQGEIFAHQVVEIDESMFGKKRKYNKGRKFRQTWVFGLVQQQSRKVSLHIVRRRTKKILIPIINRIVTPGSYIYHDDWSSYRKLHDFGYKHGVVNHSKEFKSKEGVCTNTIEGIWGDVKTKIRTMHGVLFRDLNTYLQEYCYRYMNKDENGSIYHNFLYHLALHW